MINFQTAKMNLVQMNTNVKGKEQIQLRNMEKNVISLTSPLETVERSQVNFQGKKLLVKSLSQKELNIIAKKASELKLNAQEIKVGKQALINTMNQHGCKTINQLAQQINTNIDSLKTLNPNYKVEQIIIDFEKNVAKIDSSMNANRLFSIMDDFLIDTF